MIELAIPQRSRALNQALSVGRLLPYAKRRMVGPFIFMDHMGPAHLDAQAVAHADVLPHPHIGLSTVSYLFQGSMVHRDSLGTTATITPGAVNWMTAGRGISHSERLARQSPLGAELHGEQAWVALPEEYEESAPAFDHYGSEMLPTWQHQGVHGRLLAGTLFGLQAPTTTHSPLHYAHLVLEAGATTELPLQHAERAVLVVTGGVEVGDVHYAAGQLLVLQSAATSLTARERSTIMLLGGEPLGPRHIYWNFVSSRRERLQQAADAWQQGNIPLPPHDNQEHIPLPGGSVPMGPTFS